MLVHLKEDCRDDKEFILELLEFHNTETILKSLSDRLKDDNEIVSRIVRVHPKSIVYASLRLQEICKGKKYPDLAIDSICVSTKFCEDFFGATKWMV